MEFLQDLLPVIIYVLLSILIIVVIILIINLIKTIKNVNILLEDVENKSKKLDGLFNTIDNVSSSISGFGDKMVNFLKKLFKKALKKKKEEEDIDE